MSKRVPSGGNKSTLKGIRIDAGLCADCGRVAEEGRYHCTWCRARNCKRGMERYKRLHPNARVGKRRCSECRRHGHTLPRCPTKRAVEQTPVPTKETNG